MTALVIPLTPDDVARYEAFRVAEMAADAGGRPRADEMLDVLERAHAHLDASIRAAHRINGGVFDLDKMRSYVVLRYVIDLVERVQAHKAAAAPILYPELASRQRRRA